MNQEDEGKIKDAVMVIAEDSITSTTQTIKIKMSNSPETKRVEMTIDTVEQFMHALMLWHSTQMDLLQHMLQIPEGSTVTLGNEETGEEILLTLEGATLQGYKVGLTLALMEMGKLPFTPVDADGEELHLAATPTIDSSIFSDRVH